MSHRQIKDNSGLRLKDNFWLWGQSAGTHHAAYDNIYKLPGENKMNPAQGIIFCSNCIADIGLDTVEWTRNWIRQVGDERG